MVGLGLSVPEVAALAKGVPRVLAVAAMRCVFPGGTSNIAGVLSDGVVTSATDVTAYFAGSAGIPANSIVLDVAASYNNGNDGDVPNSITVGGAVEIGGVNYPATWATATIAGGVIGSSEPITHQEVPPYGRINVRQFTSVSAGGKWPLGRRISNQRDTSNLAGTEFGEGSNLSGFFGAVAPAGSDQTAGVGVSAVTSSGGSGYGFAPSLLRALVPATSKRWGIVGDSIAAGEGDNPRDNTYRVEGWCQRLLTNAGVPWVSVAKSGNAASSIVLGNAARRGAVLALANLTDILVEIGTNDAVSVALATFQGYMVTTWSWAAARATRVWGATLLPRTNAGNTTPATPTFGTTQPAYNAWIRDGAPLNAANVAQAVGASGAGIKRAGQAGHPLAGVIDPCLSVRSGADDSLWAAPYAPADGIHPTAAGHLKIATDNAAWAAIA